MTPYTLNNHAIRQFMEYHELKTLTNVAEMLCISASYLTQLMAGQRKLNEEMRLRIQMVTHKRQDQLFLPQPEAMPFTHQSFNMAKFYGVKKYDENSLSEKARQMEMFEDQSWKKDPEAYLERNLEPDGRAAHFKTNVFKRSMP
jgi:hypothetical protein